MLRLAGISFTFPGNQARALDGIDLRLEPGKLQAIIGENGAGKTSLARLCTGHLSNFEGELLLDERKIPALTPPCAMRLGLALVPQHPRLAPELTLWQNLVLGHASGQSRQSNWLGKTKSLAGLRANLAQWQIELPLEIPAGELDAASIHWAVIAEALLTKPRFLFLDEPSAAYTPNEVERLYALLRRCAQNGMGIAVITHRLQEVNDYCDDCFVLRKGKLIADFPRVAETKRGELMKAMFGEQSNWETDGPARAPKTASFGTPQAGLTITGLNLPRRHGKPGREINLQVSAGQICGLIGLKNHGLEQLEDILSGMAPSHGAGILFNGKPLSQLERHRWAYIPGRRFQRGIATGLSIGDNAIARLRQNLFPRSWLSKPRFNAWLAQADQELLAKPTAPIVSLSGGMIQRLIFQRELDQPVPELVIAAEPFWGLDRRFQIQLRDQIQNLSTKGITILLLLSELDEALETCDHIHVIHNNQIALSAPGPNYDRSALAVAMLQS